MSAKMFLAEEPKLGDVADWEEPYLLPRLGEGEGLDVLPAVPPTDGGT